MSQQKVDLHKQEKKNMKGAVKKRKAANVLWVVVFIAILALVAFWIGFSAYRSYQASKAGTVEQVPVDVSPLDDFNTQLGTEYTAD